MTSAEHCGLCGETCAPGPCVQGACVIAEDSGEGAYMGGVASNATELFYAGTEGGVTNLFKMPLGGGTEESLFPLMDTIIGDVFINASEVYAAFEGMSPVVAKGDKDSILSPAELDVFTAKALSRLDGADVTVCWTIDKGVQCTFDGMDQGPIDIGEQSGDVAVSNGVVYVTTDQLHVYASLTSGAMPPALLGSVPATSIAGIDVAQGQLYIAADDGIWTMPTVGGPATRITTELHDQPFDLVVDQGRVYVTTIGTPSRLYRAPSAGGDEELLYEAALVPFVEARNSYVYFSSVDEVRLYRRHVDAVAPPR
ncbi:MAG TPA: hypothetical protein ENK57_09755 [Polyangiaceae bacterium]|nr:hypothetical protein [Polyangiaceae bacterium]